MINASLQQQQQQVDDKKATNANYIRKSVNLNLTHYNNSAAIKRSIFSDSNYYVSRDHHSTIDSPDHSIISTEKSVSAHLHSNQIASSQRLSKSEAKQQQQLHHQSSHPANDQLSLLFPKCRPRNDSNLNKTGNFVDNTTSVQLTPASNLLSSSPSSGDYKNQNKSFIDIDSPIHSANDYNRAHIRDMKNHKNTENSERMQNNMMAIEDSASFRTTNYDGHTMRNNAINYQRTAYNTQHQHQQQQQQQHLHQLNNDYPKLSDFESGNHIAKSQSKWDNSSHDIRKWAECDDTQRDNIFWNKRHRSPTTTPASTVLNSPDFTESHHYSHHSAQHQIKVGRSPVNQHGLNNTEKHSTSPELYVRNVKRTTATTNMVSDTNSSHLDEIESWRIKNERNNPFHMKHEPLQNQTNDKHRRFNQMLLNDEYDYESDRKLFSTDNVTKMIGALPIAEYEGSPRRFGNNQHELATHQYQYAGNTNQSEWERPPSSRKMLTSPSLVPPRPGFPKRVSTSPSTESVTKKVSEENHTANAASQLEKPNQSSSSSSTEVTPSPVVVPKSAKTKTILEERSPVNPLSGNNTTQNSNKTLLDSNDSGGVSTEPTDTKNSTAYSTTFDYLYEFSETRKVLEDFFKCPNNEDEKKIVDCFNESDTGSFDNLNEIDSKESEINFIDPCVTTVHSNNKDYDNDTTYQTNRITKSRYPNTNDYSNQQINEEYENNDVELYLDSNSRSSGELGDTELDMHHHRRYSRHFTLSPETTDYDSNCGDLDSLSNDLNGCIGINSNSGNAINCSTIISDYSRLYTSMPVLEDGLSSGHASDTENNNPVMYLTSNGTLPSNDVTISSAQINHVLDNKNMANDSNNVSKMLTPIPVNLTGNGSNLATSINLMDVVCPTPSEDDFGLETIGAHDQQQSTNDEQTHVESKSYMDSEIGSIFPTAPLSQISASHNNVNNTLYHDERNDIAHAQIMELRNSMQSKALQPSYQQSHQQQQSPDDEQILTKNVDHEPLTSPIWLPRHQHNQSHESLNSEHILSKPLSADDEEADTDLETDRLLGQQRLDDHGFYDDKSSSNWCDRSRSIKSPSSTLKSSKTIQQQHSQTFSSASIRQGIGSSSSIGVAAACANIPLNMSSSPSTNHSSNQQMLMNQSLNHQNDRQDNMCLTSPDKSHISNLQRSPSDSLCSKTETDKNRSAKSRNKEGRYWEPAVLIEGVLFRARYLGSTQLVCEGQPTKSTRMMQAEEAVSRIKAPEGETQPSTEVDLFISTEKIMVLNTDLKEIMMDHALRTISYIADIGDLVVLMARRRFVPSDADDAPKLNRTPKMICHVFESDEAQFIAQSIGQAFQVAYMEFLKANGIEDHSFVKEMDYQEVLNSQEIFGDELEIFAKKELQKEVVVPKTKGEILGMVIVESGWGSMLPTVVIANLLSSGAAARCGQLNIGDQIIAINGLSLVGLPLSTCQSYIRNTKNQTAVKFTVVPCPPVVEVKIKRPNTKYQLGFSVQNGVICSLLRGGIAERGGVRVGHRIIEINNQSVVAVPHEKIVNLLATSVGEILMKTMPTSMFRLLTGQENPLYI